MAVKNRSQVAQGVILLNSIWENDNIEEDPDIAGMIATEITYIGEWAFTQYRRNAQFLSKI